MARPRDLGAPALAGRRGGPVRNHGDWRPDWTVERRSWWWYATFETDHVVRRAARAGAARLAPDAPVDLVPRRWLHLSLVEVGYVADVPRQAAYEQARTGQDLVRDVGPVELHLGPVTTMDSAVVLPVLGRGVAEVHQHLVTATRTSLPLPEQRPLEPHVSIAYVRRDGTDHDVLGPPEPDARPAPRLPTTTLDRVSLVEVVRGPGHYRWTPRCVVRLGRPWRGHDATAPPGAARRG